MAGGRTAGTDERAPALSDFSKRELRRCQWLGAVVVGIGLLAVLISWLPAVERAAVPEFLAATRGCGWTGASAGVLWTALAWLRLLLGKEA
jgi:hypothetical protein